jgi:competence protein ComEA
MKNKDKIIGSIAILVVFIIFFLFGILNKNQENYNNEDIFVESTSSKTEENKSSENSQNKIIKVQIKGEIKAPGVYTLSSGERVEDLIRKAGGLTSEADTDRIVSQAKKLRDEECIVIPKKIEEDSSAAVITNGEVKSNASSNTDGKVNVNTATKEELMKVPGIGEVIADNIIRYRENNGDFMSLDDLKKVDRIGEKTLEKMKEKLEAN